MTPDGSSPLARLLAEEDWSPEGPAAERVEYRARASLGMFDA